MRYSLSPVRWLPISALQPLSPHPSRLWCILDLQRRTPLRPLKVGEMPSKTRQRGFGYALYREKTPQSRASRTPAEGEWKRSFKRSHPEVPLSGEPSLVHHSH